LAKAEVLPTLLVLGLKNKNLKKHFFDGKTAPNRNGWFSVNFCMVNYSN